MAHELPKYPKDHPVGMEVPKGGSSCAKCEFVSNDGKQCSQKDFVKWNGGKDLPEAADRYCCDFFTVPTRTKPRSAKELRREK